MIDNKPSLRLQWGQLLAVSGAHFLVDVYAGMMPAILPAVRDKFNISLTMGVALISTLYISCNIMQIGTGHVRAQKDKPLLMYIGLALGAVLCSFAAFPAQEAGVEASIYIKLTLILLVIIAASGLAMVHPEGLRAVHRLDGIQPAMSTAVFMAGGFMGFASGGYIATLLVEAFGFKGLYFLCLGSAAGIAAIYLLRVRLAVEKTPTEVVEQKVAKVTQLPFWPLMMIAIPATTATTVFCSLLPSRLEELGYALSYGGIATLIYGGGSAIGSFLWAPIAHRKGEMKLCAVLHLAGLPFLFAYLGMMDNGYAVILLAAAGFLSSSAYPLVVTMARSAKGLTLGLRMGLVVGGAWGLAAVPLQVLGPVAEEFGIQIVLWYTPIGYVIAGVAALMLAARGKAKMKIKNEATSAA
ncbi:Major Facilitator Superfamily protein [Anaerohalosphaera lusitana]|uniref:Major Facilitator Superfamily protein n=1 Tax=Anaerohalosphaera lusitana TaxID=1936003 RepID=A0A1U9NI72_9BACT|nr:MFS transporter [Anaerohalosphaera lusitana]AQT67300.1 Major Facilitator Superfamily protein [Anaerohalosphaera lusitana]